jgi:serine/threonine protein kinase/TolB-like protein/Tfp pilus assembly protein PilF
MEEPLSPNTRLSHYQIISMLGAGGMGEVYLAEDTRLDRKVALKLLPEQFTRDEERVRRFVQEAKAASALNHPNIITIHEIGQTEDRHYIATEFIEGETLRDKLSRGPLTVNETLGVGIQVAGALDAAHKAGVIHRDIKPENVMVRRDDIVKVLDFGLAKLIGLRIADCGLRIEEDDALSQSPQANPQSSTRRGRNPQLTHPGVVMGTVGYMAPELVRGREVDVRADAFSLGVILYEMLTGQAPFLGETPSDVIVALLEKEPPPIARLAPDTPAELRHIVNNALRKDREERYQSVKSMLADLKALKQELEFAASQERSASMDSAAGLPRASVAAASGLPEAEESDGLDLAHVLFCDIVGYSLLPIDQQTQMMRQLQEIVRQTEAYRRAEASHQLVRLPAGDGMALAFLHDLSAPVRCAFEIARALKAHPEIRLRMGVNTGPVFRSADINANRNVVGSGINMAQRVMDCGDAGHILVSRNVAEALSQVSRWQSYLHDLGEIEVKHGVRIHLYNIYSDEVGNAEAPTKIRTRISVTPQTTSSAKIVLGEVKRHKLGLAVTLATLAVAIGAAWFFLFARSDQSSIRALAVLPFVNVGNDPNTEYLSDGISESLINNLSQLPQLKVIARSTSFRYKGKEVDLQEVGKSLGVEGILTGRVLQRGDNLLISVELVNARDKTQVWGEQYNRKQSDLVTLQSEIARDVSSKLKTKLSGEDTQKLTKQYTENAEAYQLLLKGRFFLNRRTAEGLQKAIEYFNQAIVIDPNYALGYAGLADTYLLLGLPDATTGALSPQDSVPKARAAAEKALQIDSSVGEVYFSLGQIRSKEHDWAGAERAFDRGVKLSPNYPIGRLYYAVYLASLGRQGEAVKEIRRAQELDPLSLPINASVMYVLYFGRQYDEAIAAGRKALEMDAAFPLVHQRLGMVYLQKKMYQEAILSFQQAANNSNRAPLSIVSLGYAYAVSGNNTEAQRVLAELKDMSQRQYVSPYSVATIYAGLGEKEQAFQWLEKASDEQNTEMVFLKVDPRLDPLRSDPRFQELLRKVGFPQ